MRLVTEAFLMNPHWLLLLIILSTCLLFTGCLKSEFSKEGPPASKFDFSPDGTKIAVQYDFMLLVLRSDDLQSLTNFTLDEPDFEIIDHTWNSDGTEIIVLSKYGVDPGYTVISRVAVPSIVNASPINSAKSPQLPHKLSNLAPNQNNSDVAIGWYQANESFQVVHLEGNQTIMEGIEYGPSVAYTPKYNYLTVVSPASCFVFFSLPNYTQSSTPDSSCFEHIAWSRDGSLAATLTAISSSYAMEVYSFSEDPHPVFSKLYTIPLNLSNPRGLDLQFSPNARYLTLAGSDGFSECPDDGYTGVCSQGFVMVADLKTKNPIWSHEDTNGKSKHNTAYMDWTPDGKLAYLFSYESFGQLRTIDPANFIR